MKIALQLFGNLRTFRHCVPSLQKFFLDRYDCDVFIHTWDKTEHDAGAWYSEERKTPVLAVDEALICEIRELYRPCKLLVESQDGVSAEGTFGTHQRVRVSQRGLKGMTLSMERVNELRESYAEKNEIEYDFVVVTRPDVLLFRPLVLEEYLPEFTYNPGASIHFIRAMKVINSGRFLAVPLALEAFYFSRPETVSRISSIHSHFDRMYYGINSILPPGVDSAEAAFVEFLSRQGVCPRYYDFHYAIRRKRLEDMPPNEFPPELRSQSAFKRSLKDLIRALVRVCPTFALDRVRTVLGLMTEFLRDEEDKQTVIISR